MDQLSSDLVSQFKASGLTQDSFCKINDIPLERLRYHLYKRINNKTTSYKNPKENKNTMGFISFEKADKPVLSDTASHFTIIHGKFTHQQLVKFIRVLGDNAC
jgi:hypothetical protein